MRTYFVSIRYLAAQRGGGCFAQNRQVGGVFASDYPRETSPFGHPRQRVTMKRGAHGVTCRTEAKKTPAATGLQAFLRINGK